MAVDLSGFYFLDGADLFKTYGLIIHKGSADFLSLPQKKESIEHSWPDRHGVDVDLSQMFLEAKTGTLECYIFTNTRDEFFTKFEAFKSHLLQPGARRLTIAAHGGRSYFIHYVDMSQYRQIMSVKLEVGLPVMHQFNLVVREPEPQMSYADLFIATDDGGFLIG